MQQSKQSRQTQTETPTALQENSGEIVSYKRGSNDLLESLYNELVSKTPVLKEVEQRIDNLQVMKNDSSRSFNNYHSKNESYYRSAQSHTDYIKDSALKTMLKAEIAASLAVYSQSITVHKNLISQIEMRDSSLYDLHLVLKVVRTLPLIRQYQKDNLPSKKPFEALINGYDKTIQQTKKLIKK